MLNKVDAFPQQFIESNEIPEGFVPVYVTVPKEVLPIVLEKGLLVENNQMKYQNRELEDLFVQVAEEMNTGFDRRRCNYAYPKYEDVGKLTNSNPDEVTLLEVQIDPHQPMIVVDGELYTEADTCFHEGRIFYSEDPDFPTAEEWVRQYWEKAVSLKEYLEDQDKPKKERLVHFISPEVIIPFDIPKERIRVIM